MLQFISGKTIGWCIKMFTENKKDNDELVFSIALPPVQYWPALIDLFNLFWS